MGCLYPCSIKNINHKNEHILLLVFRIKKKGVKAHQHLPTEDTLARIEHKKECSQVIHL